jgi:acyl-CoA dehydrogenase
MDDHPVHLKERFTLFAQKYIAGRDLNTNAFPFDIWEKMAVEGLLDLGIKERSADHYLSLAMAGEALVEAGGNLGLALSWLMQQIVSRFFIMGFGNTQQQGYFSALSSGKKTVCLAISEPETGAHPKYLRTRALPEGNHYVLSGEKTYLTNGPIADLFVVIAITGEQGPKKRFTAFIVPKESPGLSITPIDIPFLKPSPHGSLHLDHCLIPKENMLWREGSAYEDMVLLFRELEDALMMGPLVGAMERQIELLIPLIMEKGHSDESASTLGLMQALIHVGRLLAYAAAGMLDSDTRGEAFLSMLLVFRALARQFVSLSEEVMSKDAAGPALTILRNDFHYAIHIADTIARIKQKKLGESLLSTK